MNQSLLSIFGDPMDRVNKALSALKSGQGVLLVDDENRENEGDLIFSTAHLNEQQVALLIRECSGIVCLCLTAEKIKQLNLPQMVKNNNSRFSTAFTVSIEAKENVTTGVSAADRLTTIKVACAINSQPEDLCNPGHIFPLKAHPEGVLKRRGHTEGTVDLMKLAGLEPSGVLCELTNENGSMANLPEIVSFALKHKIVVVTIEDIVLYRTNHFIKTVA